jgi:hypothetical protein
LVAGKLWAGISEKDASKLKKGGRVEYGDNDIEAVDGKRNEALVDLLLQL